jgi:hypothetical protein
VSIELSIDFTHVPTKKNPLYACFKTRNNISKKIWLYALIEAEARISPFKILNNLDKFSMRR